ncbi:hypothetical protein MTX78_01785 [Hymenobacter tibetensis]|uniref:Uncharacterized protein n=1 Tax=Hymenobacter tibetensis TaxID=497967 RepID=A0ABY4D0G0_9BACT|nr:hypothetical protein [Hymenobacter tibetensis]UOG75339.1 hypothetical protein MTX78_01785 [Hymenobacter tibetensis]
MIGTFRRALAVLGGLLAVLNAAFAQTPLGQPSFDEQKVQVWCATAKFVYEDNGRPNLKSTLRCGGTLKEFENSIKADSQRVFSALYQPLEGRGIIYKGLGSNPSRLQKLKTEIINRLKSSPARRASPARMQRLAALETSLTNYVDNGTPIGDQAEELAEENPDEEAATEEVPVPGDAGLSEAGVAQAQDTARGSGDSLMNRFFAPLALIVALLSLVLYMLMRRNLAVFQKELVASMTQRQDEIMAARPTPTPAAAPAASAQSLSPELHRQIEQLVQQRLEAELAKHAPLAAPVAAVAQPLASTEVPPAAAPPLEVPRVIAQPVAVVAPAPSTPEFTTAVPATATIQDTPIPMTEVPGPPVVIPAGSPASALREDFESVVPAVQVPGPAEEPVAESFVRYSPAFRANTFQAEEFTEELQPDSVYEIYLDMQWPELATFQVSPAPSVQAYLLQDAPPDLLAAACEYEQPAGLVTQVITVEEGILRKVEGVWQVEQKALVQFEE